MHVTFSHIHFDNNKRKNTVYVSPAVAKQLRLRGKRTVALALGNRQYRSQVQTYRRKGRHLLLPKTVHTAIRAPLPGRMMVATDATRRRIRIGPLIGILTNGIVHPTHPFGTRTPFLREILLHSPGKAYAFAFTPRDVHWQQQTVTGMFANPQGGWLRLNVPLPDVVYNRLASRQADRSPAILALKNRLIRHRIPFFNWSFYNKSDVYRLLAQQEDIKRYLPQSLIRPSASQFQAMLKKHPFLYVKPTTGSLGKGIFRVATTPRGYTVRSRIASTNMIFRFGTFASMWKHLTRGQGRLHAVVVQQGIRLLAIEGRPIDFRVHLMRDETNAWVVSGMGCKKAGKGSITTHIRNGGTLLTPETALWSLFGERADTLLTKIKDVCMQLAQAIVRRSTHHIGELGFDIGVDEDENIWMFEVNAKPGHSIFKHPALREEGKRTLSLFYAHCLYLAKFKRQGGQKR
jgi:hypothetical protein